MKKLILLISTAILLFNLAACSAHSDTNTSTDDATLPDYVSILQNCNWPENEFTQGLPIPTGTVEWVILDTKQNTCSISSVDVNEESYQEYIQSLRNIGFSEVTSTSEQIEGESYVSIGTILSSDTRLLSVAYANGNLVIYISNVTT